MPSSIAASLTSPCLRRLPVSLCVWLTQKSKGGRVRDVDVLSSKIGELKQRRVSVTHVNRK